MVRLRPKRSARNRKPVRLISPPKTNLLISPQSKISLEGQLAYTTVSAVLQWNRRMRLNREEVVRILPSPMPRF